MNQKYDLKNANEKQFSYIKLKKSTNLALKIAKARLLHC